MSRTLALARLSNRSATQQPTGTHWWHGWKISTQKMAILASGVAFVTGFAYVLLTNNTAAQGFAIKTLEREITSLQQQNERLELKAADLRALSSVSLSSQTLDLQPTDQVEYLSPTTSAVAVRP